MFEIDPHSKHIISGFGINLAALKYLTPYDQPVYYAILDNLLDFQNRYNFQTALAKINKQLLKDNKPILNWGYISDNHNFYLYFKSKQLYDQTPVYSKQELIQILKQALIILLTESYLDLYRQFAVKFKKIKKEKLKDAIANNLNDNQFNIILDADTNLDL